MEGETTSIDWSLLFCRVALVISAYQLITGCSDELDLLIRRRCRKWDLWERILKFGNYSDEDVWWPTTPTATTTEYRRCGGSEIFLGGVDDGEDAPDELHEATECFLKLGERLSPENSETISAMAWETFIFEALEWGKRRRGTRLYRDDCHHPLIVDLGREGGA